MVPMPWSAQAQANKTQKDPRKADGNKVLLINLEEYGPVKINQAAFAVLKPAITIERHDDQLEISLRFHLQTSILGFEEVSVYSARFLWLGTPSAEQSHIGMESTSRPSSIFRSSTSMALKTLSPPNLFLTPSRHSK